VLRLIDFKPLNDDTFLIWCEVTNQAPLTELKRRSTHSKRMQVEYLQALTASEFKKQRQLKAKRKLNRNQKTLNEDLIGDIIDIKIDTAMSVSTLYALKPFSIFVFNWRRCLGLRTSRFMRVYAETSLNKSVKTGLT